MNEYDYYIIAFSGGKDSIACFLHLLEIGIPKSKIELWHHIIDGREGSTLMDWPVTEDYCRKFAAYFNVPIYFSWKTDGFEGEMLRENSRTKPNRYEYLNDDNIIECGLTGGKRGKLSTRRKFPQVTANLNQRWCSAYLKIDVCTAAITNQKRFLNKKTLVITGERAEESAARAKYKELEPDRSDNRDGKRVKRWVDHWRPVHNWCEAKVWYIMQEHGIVPHPAYRLGWGRLSCMFCIFGSKNQWASAFKVDRERVQKIIDYENEFGVTIHRSKSVSELIYSGVEYPSTSDAVTIAIARSTTYHGAIYTDNWELPAGAFGENVGPT